MNPIHQLMEDHEIILEVLQEVEQLALKLQNGGEILPEKWKNFINFVRQFADGIHHAKEEEFLFPALRSAGLSVEGGPIGCMLHEHKMGRYLIGELERGLQRGGENPMEAREKILQNARGYIDLLRSHIQKENQVLFVMAERLLSLSDKQKLKEAFQTLDQGSENQSFQSILL